MFNIYNSIASTLKAGMSDYCHIECNSPSSEYEFVTRDGGFMTFLKVDGSFSVAGSHSLANLISAMELKLSAALTQSGHKVTFSFYRNPRTFKA